MGSGGIEYERLVLPLKLACQAFSCWPYTIHPLYQAFVLVGLLTWVSSCTAELPMLLAGDDVNRTIEASLITLASYMTVVRFLLFSLRREEMLYVLEVMRCDWTSVQDNAEDARLLISKTLGTFRLSKLFMLNTFIAGLAFAVLPALELENCSGEVAEARLGTDARAEQPLQACVKRAAQQAFLAGGDGRAGVLPFGGRYFFNHTRSGSVYAATYAGNALVGGIGCSTIAGATCFSLITTIHASAKFALVRRHFESISHAEWMGRSTGKFRLCVREHQQCIKDGRTDNQPAGARAVRRQHGSPVLRRIPDDHDAEGQGSPHQIRLLSQRRRLRAVHFQLQRSALEIREPGCRGLCAVDQLGGSLSKVRRHSNSHNARQQGLHHYGSQVLRHDSRGIFKGSQLLLFLLLGARRQAGRLIVDQANYLSLSALFSSSRVHE
ncbi:uncharacterized protein LOC131674364 isoform X1 [Phymastichus coffea]|uniref:uncharacterized protein LOC131674364 isoform X1 n=1 Tax=Phymastichus coffea TaxID=108790 RepID=UPI00273C7983|nr:uncharacterized protein LOC131674364 isoform X1 [Phymastichus coffea]